MNKKVFSSVLAGAMAVSTLGVAASAAESTNTFTAKASLQKFTINADIPAELETFINPYGAQVKGTKGTGVVTAVGYSDGIISPVYSIENKDANAGLKVSATAKITGSNTVALMTKPMDEVRLAKATEKQVFAFLNTTIDAATTTPVFANTKFVGNDNQLAFTEDGAKAADIMVLDKSGATTGKTGYFYVGGQCTPNPETAWDNKDTVTVDLILDLVPSAGAAADLSLASLTIDGTASIEKEFDGTKTAYTLMASGSGTKYSALTATAQLDPAGTTTFSNVYVKLNGKFISATQAATATAPGATITAGTAAAGAKAVINPPTGTDKDFKAGDTIEFIVVNGTTNESATYTITFE